MSTFFVPLLLQAGSWIKGSWVSEQKPTLVCWQEDQVGASVMSESRTRPDTPSASNLDLRYTSDKFEIKLGLRCLSNRIRQCNEMGSLVQTLKQKHAPEVKGIIAFCPKLRVRPRRLIEGSFVHELRSETQASMYPFVTILYRRVCTPKMNLL